MYEGVGVIREKIKFELPVLYDLSMTCHSHGWKNLAPFSWDDREQKLHFSTCLNEVPVDVEVCRIGKGISATITSHDELDESSLSQASKIITRSLGLDVDTSELFEIAKRVGPEYVDIISKGAGRLLKSPTLWEDAAKTLFTTNCTWSLTQKMCEAVCSETFSRKAPSGNYPFPGAKVIGGYSAGQIKKLMPIGYRSEYLIPLAKRFVEDPYLEDIESKGFSYKKADKLVRGIRGFGNYAVAHLLIMSGYFNEVPIDTVVVAYLKENYRVRKPQSFIDRNYRKWGKYKWWGLKLEKIIKRQNWLGD